jgi:hypothetical protein
MPTGLTDTSNETRDQVIAEALTNVGAIGIGDVRDSNNSTAFDVAAAALNRIAKDLDKEGAFLWRFIRRTTATTAGTASITLGTDVLVIDAPMRFTRNGQTASTQITPMARDEYMQIGDRTVRGVPSRYYVEVTLTTKTVYLWPTPDATSDTIEYVAVLRAKDFTSGTDTPDFTQKWQSCLVYRLTMELCPKFGQREAMGDWKALYEDEKKRLVQDDSEKGPVSFVPFANYRCGAG